MRSLAVALLAVVSAGCNEARYPTGEAAKSEIGHVPPEPQRAGDPVLGYDALVNRPYVTCGIPQSTYDQLVGPAPVEMRLPGREGRNATLPYAFTAFTAKSGVDLVSANCLGCHAAFFDGELIVGLGNESTDYTEDLSFYAEAVGAFVDDGPERDEWRKWADRVAAIAPYSRPTTVGVNPADNFTFALLAHRNRETLAWSERPLLELPPTYVLPVSVPPWWRMAKKNAMFYNASGRGDHARYMMAAANLCTDTVEEALEIDAFFPDVRAFISSIEPPRWKWAIDDARVRRGAVVFSQNCARCHGGPTALTPYPDRVISLEEVGTDPAVALGAYQEIDRFIDWFNGSFYGALGRFAPARGYVAPPLDGVWATAPYLHNGSVPTIAALLESGTRPRFWTRSFDSSDYDTAALGWTYTELDHGKADEEDADARARIYDTTQLGYSNAGHTFGDALTDEDRLALLEYLKTL